MNKCYCHMACLRRNNCRSRLHCILQEFSTTLYLRQIWQDERLAFNGERNVTLNHKQFDRMWTPDVFIRNLKSGIFHTITVPNRLIRLSPDGTILYSQRLTLTLACDMLLNKYPMDNQTCKIEFGSCKSFYQYTMYYFKPAILPEIMSV